MKLFKIQAKNIRGQGMSEYVIIVALIAVAAIAVTGLFGNTARTQIAGMAAELGGGDGAKNVEAAGKYATKAEGENVSTKTRNLSNYNSQEDTISQE